MNPVNRILGSELPVAFHQGVSSYDFFVKRFNRMPEYDRRYYMEWVGRFRKGPIGYMDLDSKRVFDSLK